MTAHMLAAALELAAAGWEVLPLNGKVPALARHPECKANGCQATCDHDRRVYGHGVLDATTDPALVTAWWTARPDANIGARVPAGLVVLDVDPQESGPAKLADLERAAGQPLPDTLTVRSGRGDGSRHHYLRHPGGRLVGKVMVGLDVRSRGNYLVMPPSLHPDTGQPYAWADVSVPPAFAPAWLLDLLRIPTPPPAPPRRPWQGAPGTSIADAYTASTSWRDILAPHGWRLLSGDGDTDGSTWERPGQPDHGKAGATVRHGCLFVYTTSTPFTPTSSSDVHGYTRFHAYAVLDHQGDQKAAARALRTEAQARA